MKKNPYIKFTPVENPYELPKPAVPKPERYVSQLTQVQSQEIRLAFAHFLAEHNLFNLLEDYLPKLDLSISKRVLQMKVNIFRKDYDAALSEIESLLAESSNENNIEFLLFKAEICYQSDRMFECEEIFLSILRLNPPQSTLIEVYLRLGSIYLNRKAWEDCKQVLEKAVEQKHNCSVAWLGLGIANLNLNFVN